MYTIPGSGPEDEGYGCVEEILGALWDERDHDAFPREGVEKL